LEDNQTHTMDLTQKATVAPVVSPEVQLTKSEEPKIVFDLLEDIEVVEAKQENGLIPTTEAIKNIEVTFEIVDAKEADKLMYITPEIKEMIVREPEFVIVESTQPKLSFEFDAPKAVVNEAPVLFTLDVPVKNTPNDIKVNEPVQVIPVTEVNKEGVIRYSLEEYMEVEQELINSKPVETVTEVVQEELQITLKSNEEAPKSAAGYDELNPMEMTIEETLKMRAEERRKKLKEFNYKFHNHNRLEELERVPAYKRQGTELKDPSTQSNASRLSIGTDSNDDVQLRSNNSFLHDNVD
jgi:cell division protein FtsZ